MGHRASVEIKPREWYSTINFKQSKYNGVSIHHCNHIKIDSGIDLFVDNFIGVYAPKAKRHKNDISPINSIKKRPF